MQPHALIEKDLILCVVKERLGGKAEGSKEKTSWTELSKGKSGLRVTESCRLEGTSGNNVVKLHCPSWAHFNDR